MGAGRRTETVSCNGHSLAARGGIPKTAPQRKLAERNRLGSVIFGCSNGTFNECVTNKLFGLPYSHHSYVDYIPPGMPLFLFNYNDRKMHGIFEAVSQGALNISPSAWTKDNGGRTQFPAQVRVLLRADFSGIVSLTESVFKETLIDSYYQRNKFFFELDIEQTDRLIRLFERAAENQYRPVAPECTADASQTLDPGKVWKKTNGGGKIDDILKLKKPELQPSTSEVETDLTPAQLEVKHRVLKRLTSIAETQQSQGLFQLHGCGDVYRTVSFTCRWNVGPGGWCEARPAEETSSCHTGALSSAADSPQPIHPLQVRSFSQEDRPADKWHSSLLRLKGAVLEFSNELDVAISSLNL